MTSYTYMNWNKETSCNLKKIAGWELRGKEDEGDLTNVQYKPNWNCHYEFSPV
jgi:hypothetical protein